MLKATVIGNVWSTRRLPEVPNGAFLEVEVEGGSRLIAFDVLGSGPGAKAMLYMRSNGDVTGRPIFDAAASLLPGFAKALEFAF